MPVRTRTPTCHHFDHMRDDEGFVVTRDKSEEDRVEEYIRKFCDIAMRASDNRVHRIATEQLARNAIPDGSSNNEDAP